LLFIRINVNNETNNATVKEKDEIDIPVIYNVFSKRKANLNKLGIDIHNGSWVFTVVNQMS